VAQVSDGLSAWTHYDASSFYIDVIFGILLILKPDIVLCLQGSAQFGLVVDYDIQEN